MGSDWSWELLLPDVPPQRALRRVYQLAAQRDLLPQRPDGLINLFTTAGTGLRTVDDLDTALAAMATGREHGQLWTTGETDISVTLRAGKLVWILDAAFGHRAPIPDVFRDLHRRLTALWIDVAQDLDASCGRVLDEWSTDQIWALGIHDAVHPVVGWPAELGWWTYLRADPSRAPAPLPDVAERTRHLPGGAVLVTLVDDPAAVDPSQYEQLHTRWLKA